MLSTVVFFRPCAAPTFRFPNLEIWPDELRAQLAGRPLDLTAREFEVLLALAVRRNRVVARAELYELVRRKPMIDRERSVDVLVHRLRGKLRHASPGWLYIHTHVRVGYRFAPRRQP